MHEALGLGFADASVAGGEMPVTFGRASEPQTRRPLLVCFSHLRWDFVWQRPQHLLTRAAQRYDVVFVEEPIFKAVERPYAEAANRPGGVKVVVPVLPETLREEQWIGAQRRLVDAVLDGDGRRIAVLWYYTPMALGFSGHLRAEAVVYDNMDELSAFRGASPELLEHERRLLGRADIVFTGGMSLYEAKRSRHPHVVALPSSIDAAHFAIARQGAADTEPEDQRAIGWPRLGFFGVIDERMDLDLVARVAELRPDWNLVMIGPVAKIDPETLPQAPNIHWLGQKPYADLPAYLAGWDVGLMPFALNESTRFISPTKTPEYLAAGVPVVSTRITDVVRPYGEKGLVAIADTPEQVVEAALAGMQQDRATWLEAVDAHLASGSWDTTWLTVRQALQEATSRRSASRKGQELLQSSDERV